MTWNVYVNVCALSLRVALFFAQAQYNFIHDALNELILCGDTEITAPNLRIVISRLNKTKDGETGYSKQFNVSCQLYESKQLVSNNAYSSENLTADCPNVPWSL